MAIGYAVGAMNSLTPIVLNRDLTGPLARAAGKTSRQFRAVQSCCSSALQSRKHHAV